jgi:uncharacterized protein
MWLNLAALRALDASIRNMAVKLRDEIAAKITPAQIAEAQRMAREWVPKTNQQAPQNDGPDR